MLHIISLCCKTKGRDTWIFNHRVNTFRPELSFCRRYIFIKKIVIFCSVFHCTDTKNATQWQDVAYSSRTTLRQNIYTRIFAEFFTVFRGSDARLYMWRLIYHRQQSSIKQQRIPRRAGRDTCENMALLFSQMIFSRRYKFNSTIPDYKLSDEMNFANWF